MTLPYHVVAFGDVRLHQVQTDLGKVRPAPAAPGARPAPAPQAWPRARPPFRSSRGARPAPAPPPRGRSESGSPPSDAPGSPGGPLLAPRGA